MTFVAETSGLDPVPALFWQHLDSSAGSGGVVHRPYWRSTFVRQGGLETPVHWASLSGTFCTRGRCAGRRDGRFGTGDGLNPGLRVAATVLEITMVAAAMETMLALVLNVGEAVEAGSRDVGWCGVRVLTAMMIVGDLGGRLAADRRVVDGDGRGGGKRGLGSQGERGNSCGGGRRKLAAVETTA